MAETEKTQAAKLEAKKTQQAEKADRAKKAAKAEHVRLREALIALFDVVDKPPSDPCDADSAPSPEATEWIVDGESYPTYANDIRWALGPEFEKLALISASSVAATTSTSRLSPTIAFSSGRKSLPAATTTNAPLSCA